MHYPSWLKIEEPYQKENKWYCPYCNSEFDNKEKAYPKLVMTFDSYQRSYKEYPDLRSFLEDQWRTKEGHPCTAFSFYFWSEYEKYRKGENFPKSENIEVKEITKNDKKEVSDNISDFSSLRELRSSNKINNTSKTSTKSNDISNNLPSDKTTNTSTSNIPKSTDNKINQKSAFSFKKLLYYLENKTIIKDSILILIISFIFFNFKIYQFFSLSYIYEIPDILDKIISFFLFSVLIVILFKDFSKRLIQIVKSKENGIYILASILLYSILFLTFLLHIGSTYTFINPNFGLFDLIICITILISTSYILNEYKIKNILAVILLLVLFTNIITNYNKIDIINSIVSKFSSKPAYDSYPNIYNNSTLNKNLTSEDKSDTRATIKEKYPYIIPDYSYRGNFSLNFSFFFGPKVYSINLSIPQAIYYGAKNGFKGYEYTCYTVMCKPSPNWTEEYYNAFIFDPNQKDIFLNIINQINIYTIDLNEFVEIATLFVQNIPYDYDKYYSIMNNSTTEKDRRFPVEVLVDNKGVCGEKSLLLAGILAYAGYDVVLFLFENENHMAVGIRCPCKNSFRGSGYCFIETTSLNPVGYVPEEYVGGIKLVSTPKVIKVGLGSRMYTNCFYIDNDLITYKYEIIQKLREYLDKNYKLIYREDLSRSINSQYLPYGYKSGITWKIPIENGNPNIIVAEIIKCHIIGDCYQNISDSGLRSNLTAYKYYGLDIINENGKYYLALLLAN